MTTGKLGTDEYRVERYRKRAREGEKAERLKAKRDLKCLGSEGHLNQKALDVLSPLQVLR